MVDLTYIRPIDWASIKRRQARQFEELGDIASGVGGPGCETDDGSNVNGHGVANSCWAMAAYLRKQAEDIKRREAELANTSTSSNTDGENRSTTA